MAFITEHNEENFDGHSLTWDYWRLLVVKPILLQFHRPIVRHRRLIRCRYPDGRSEICSQILIRILPCIPTRDQYFKNFLVNSRQKAAIFQ